ncbi:MAG: hypothetical protein ACHQKY_07775 [Terriglobia bacterium]
MRAKRFVVVILMFCGLGMVRVFPQTEGAQAEPSKEVFTGTVVGMGPGGSLVSRGFTLTIEGYTADADARKFARILKSQGEEGLLKAIAKEKKGTFALDGQLSHDINTVRIHRNPNGRTYTIVFERWLSFFEVRYGTRSEDYPFTYIELFVEEAKGLGGTLLPAAKIRFNKQNVIEIENFGLYPAQLMGVRRQQ